MPSNEELQQARDILSGGQIQTSPEQTPEVSEIDRARSLLSGGEQAQAQATIPGLTTADIVDHKSPLSIGERLLFSFSDDAGKEDALNKKFNFVERLPNGKFAVGDTQDTIRPIDPEGIFNDMLGDAADIVGEIPVILGQGIVTGLGATAGSIIPGAGTAGGAVLGAGAGSAAGQSLKALIGRAAGVRKENLAKEATDVALSGAFGAAGQGVVGLSSKLVQAGKGALTPMFTKAADKATANNPKVTKFLGKLFRITAKVDEKATEVGGRQGYGKLFQPKYTSPTASANISDDVVKSVANHDKFLSGQVTKAEDALNGLTKGKRIVDIGDTFDALSDDLQRIGVLGTGNVVNPNSTAKGSSKLIRLMNGMSQSTKKSIPTREGQRLSRFSRPTTKLSTRETVRLKRQMQDMIEDVSPELQVALRKAMGSFSEVGTKSASLSGKIGDIANALGDDGFAVANRNFAQFRMAQESVQKASGLKLNNQTAVEKYMKRFVDLTDTEKSAFRTLDSITPEPLYDNVEMFSAAQKFANASPDLLRIGAVMAFMGFDSDDSASAKAKRLALGLAVTTPFGIKTILKGASKASGAVKGVAKQSTKAKAKAGGRKSAITISQILESKKRKDSRKQRSR